MDPEAKQSIVARLQQANNVLVTVSANPSVDQLAACIGLTLLLNKLGKHATAVFSGQIPSTIEFLKPEDTIEKNTDSLRDFIIALDKSKADKLRYKVEDKVVKIFITPYRTSLSQNDLEFSQGDFNVDVVIGLGVHERVDLDKAITAHGRILHDATVISINNHDQGNLGSINWVNVAASSLSEMSVELAHGLTTDPLDGQMATAFMTGIVAETQRFSNEKTSPAAMSMASELMAAGANQQLIATKLDAKPPAPTTPKPAEAAESEVEIDEADGSLRIPHPASEDKPAELPPVVDNPPEEGPAPAPAEPVPQPPQPPAGPKISKIRDDLLPAKPQEEANDAPRGTTGGTSMVLEPPSLGGRLTANSEPEHEQLDPSTDPLSNVTTSQPLLSRTPMGTSSQSTDAPDKPQEPELTLEGIEESVDSPHLQAAPEEKPAEPAVESATEPAPAVAPEPVIPVPTPDPTPADSPATPAPAEPTPPVIEPLAPVEPPKPTEPEAPVDSPAETPEPQDQEDKDEEIAEAREAVDDAITEAGDQPLEPVQAMGAQPLGLNLHDQPAMTPTTPDVTPTTSPDLPVAADPLAATPPIGAPADATPAPYFPPSEPATPMGGPLFNTAPNPMAPSAAPNPLATVPMPEPAPVGQGIAPNIPPQLMPTTPPIDATAAPGNPAPPPVPPPMMPPAGGTSFNSPL